MTHLPFTLIAYFFNALSVLTNKFLLNKAIPDPFVYIFYISLLSLLALLLLPFTLTPSPFILILASLSTVLWAMGAYFMFKALKVGQISRVIPIIGTLIPLFLLSFSLNSLTPAQIWTVFILIVGMIVLTINDWKGKFKKNESLFELLSSVSFAFSYTLLRQAYLQHDFFSVVIWSRLILIPFILVSAFVLRGKLNSNVLPRGGHWIIFLGGQAAGVLSEFLILYSISLATPALVNSLQGTQYVFLFIFTLLLAKKYPKVFTEKYSLLNLSSKLLGIGLIGVGLYLLAI